MQSGVFAFIIINVNSDFLDQAQRLAISRLVTLKIGPKNVVGFAGGDTLGKLAIVVGKELPLGFFVFGAPNLYGYAVDGVVVRSPDCPEDEGIRLFGLAMMLRGTWAGAEHQRSDQEGD